MTRENEQTAWGIQSCLVASDGFGTQAVLSWLGSMQHLRLIVPGRPDHQQSLETAAAHRKRRG